MARVLSKDQLSAEGPLNTLWYNCLSARSEYQGGDN